MPIPYVRRSMSVRAAVQPGGGLGPSGAGEQLYDSHGDREQEHAPLLHRDTLRRPSGELGVVSAGRDVADGASAGVTAS